jgi:hypothetical protein
MRSAGHQSDCLSCEPDHDTRAVGLPHAVRKLYTCFVKTCRRCEVMAYGKDGRGRRMTSNAYGKDRRGRRMKSKALKK